jgi:small-conductance mechanosensitive channel
MRMTMYNTERRTFNTTVNSPTDLRTQHVRSEADKLLERRIRELSERLQGSDDRLERQKEYLRELAEERAKHQETCNKNREENMTRQQRKNEYKKEQLTSAQKEQEEKLQKVDEVKRSMLLQSKCMRLSNDMRKYHLKKEIEKNKRQYITVDRLMDINEKYGSGAGMQLSIDMPEDEAKKKIVELLGIILDAPGRKTSTRQGGFTRVSSNRQSAPRNSGSL